MSLLKRFSIIGIFLNIALLYFWPAVSFIGEYTGLRKMLAFLLPFEVLLVFLFLIVGCVPKRETKTSKTICATGLFIMAFSVFSIAYCWDFGHNGVYNLFQNLQTADINMVKIYIGTVANQNLTKVALDEDDTARVVALLQQITCRNPYANVKNTDAQGSGCFNYSIAKSDGTFFGMGVWPPYYVDIHERAYLAEDEEVCQQLADLYTELRAKYESQSIDVAVVE